MTGGWRAKIAILRQIFSPVYFGDKERKSFHSEQIPNVPNYTQHIKFFVVSQSGQIVRQAHPVRNALRL